MAHRYNLEFILTAHETIQEALSDALAALGESLLITPQQAPGELKVSMVVEDPTLVFDACAEFGRIKSVKVEEAEKEGS